MESDVKEIPTKEVIPNRDLEDLLVEHDDRPFGQENSELASQETERSLEEIPVPEPKLWLYTTNKDHNDFHISWTEPKIPEEAKTENFTINSYGLSYQIADDVRGGEWKTIGEALADGNSLVVLKDGHGLNGEVRWGSNPKPE